MYSITINRVDGEQETVVSAAGPLSLVAYAVKAAELEDGTEYRAVLTHGADTVKALTSDGETVTGALKAKITLLRKAEKPAENAPAPAGE